ncbi:MAG: trehalose-6-phosphate synthase, partial [Elusimicrobia bacterium]|nr:trehalose-6-phosphate synthase [Elusimicrobiota bacterium]
MRITVRLIFSLVFAATMVVAVSTYWQIGAEKKRLVEDLQRRSAVMSDTLQDIVAPALAAQDKKRLRKTVEKYENRERLIGIALFGPKEEELALTPALESDLPALRPLVSQAFAEGGPTTKLTRDRYRYVGLIRPQDSVVGALAMVRDASFIRARLSEMWRHNFFRLLFHAVVISLISLLIVRWNVLAPLDQMADWMRQVRSGRSPDSPPPPANFLGPLVSEATHLAQSLAAARASVEEEAKLRQQSQSLWTPERLKEQVKEKLDGRPLFVVANREPYMHVRQGRKIQVIVPASGLVTGIEPILLACGGTWIGQGAGDADRETADENGKLPVPPEEPKYTLKRVWLTKEEEEG